MHERTNHATMNDHLSPDTLASYFTHGLSDAEQSGVEEHLADCDTCIGSARTTFAASGLIDRWTADVHGQAVLQGVLVQALAASRQQPSLAAWRERLAQWAERWVGQAEAAVRIMLEAPGSAARVLTDGMEGLARPGASWQFAPVPTAMPTRGPAGRRATSQPVIVSAGGDGTPSARVSVSGQRGEVAVRLDDLPAGQEPPLVLLVPTDRGGEPRLTLPVRQPDADFWIARFEKLEPGDYLVAFEPLA
jgi:hypothetical protein